MIADADEVAAVRLPAGGVQILVVKRLAGRVRVRADPREFPHAAESLEKRAAGIAIGEARFVRPESEIERGPRGVYCGAIGYFGFSGHTDLNIAIRTAMFTNGTARFQGGGGITARSNPAAEYEETLTKISRIMEAFAP